MLKRQTVAIEDVYVPVKRRQALDPNKVEALAESILTRDRKRPFWCEKTARALSWLRACIGWKPVGHWVRQLCRPISFRPGIIERPADR